MVVITDMSVQVIFEDNLTQIMKNLLRRGDRRLGPGLESITKGIKVTVGTDAGIGMSEPGATEALHLFQHQEAFSRALLPQVVGRTNAGYAGTNDNYIKMLGFS